jgi:membrane fusion protein (multidrug efflux system)
MLRAGDVVATIVPEGGLHVVASFAPAEAFGRVRPGQAARVRLDGFPHTQFGTIAAVVSHVAEEVRDGGVRVELRLTSSNAPVALQHGLPASVEVAVESMPPVALALRALGRRLATPVAAAHR